MDKIQIGQIGVGNWGKNLLRNFFNNPQIKINRVCDLNSNILNRITHEYPECIVTTQVEDVINDPTIQAVVIATQPITHYELAKKALLNGKHVFVEKPMVLDVQHGEELVQLAAESQKIVMVGHILEYHPAFLKLKDMITSGELGEVYYIYTTRVNLGIVREEENSLWSFAPHDISIILMLMDQEPQRVVCCGQGYLRKEVEDVTFTTLHFKDHKMAHLHVSWLDPHKIRKVTVVGSKKMVVVDDMESTEKMRIYDKGVNFQGTVLPYGEAITLRTGDIQIPYIKMQEPLQLEVQHFVDCIRNGKMPRSDAKDGLRVVKILDAAQKSLKQHGVPIEF